jgi:hypothetical protein
MVTKRWKIRDVNLQFIKEKTYGWLDDHIFAVLLAGFVSLVLILMLIVDHFFPGYGQVVALVALALTAGFLSRFIGC